jgi:post-segregation antitoxin (ccd killing protein)
MEKRIAAKRGNRAADTWLRNNAEAIAIAYEERRIVD